MAGIRASVYSWSPGRLAGASLAGWQLRGCRIARARMAGRINRRKQLGSGPLRGRGREEGDLGQAAEDFGALKREGLVYGQKAVGMVKKHPRRLSTIALLLIT